jgi:hypothetical protein
MSSKVREIRFSKFLFNHGTYNALDEAAFTSNGNSRSFLDDDSYVASRFRVSSWITRHLSAIVGSNFHWSQSFRASDEYDAIYHRDLITHVNLGCAILYLRLEPSFGDGYAMLTIYTFDAQYSILIAQPRSTIPHMMDEYCFIYIQTVNALRRCISCAYDETRQSWDVDCTFSDRSAEELCRQLNSQSPQELWRFTLQDRHKISPD